MNWRKVSPLISNNTLIAQSFDVIINSIKKDPSVLHDRMMQRDTGERCNSPPLLGNHYRSEVKQTTEYFDGLGRWKITGNDIYTYFGYLQTINEGLGSWDNMVEGLNFAAGKNDGTGGAMEATLKEFELKGSRIPLDYSNLSTTNLFAAFNDEAIQKKITV